MKKHLLVAASALLVGLSFGTNAWADGDGHDHGGDNSFLNASTAVAASVQAGEVEDNFAKGTVGSNDTGAINGTGLINVQQNNGANSQLQDANTLGAILDSCACSTNTADITANTALAVSAQFGSVEGNKSIGAKAETRSGSSESSADIEVKGSEGKFSFEGEFSHEKTWNNAEAPVGSSNYIASVGGTGLINISQNNGNNSLLQSSNTVAAVIHSGK
ncbi:MAG TPA: hypothetical protein VJS41_03885 [Stellaceae bacterium]|nr:hypothetical protein [Stellaceae bacterium]